MIKLEDYGVTEDGFRMITYPELLEFYRQEAKELFGNDINLNSHSLLGILIENRAWNDSILWEKMQDVYYSSFYEYAEGVSLTNTGKYVGAGRKPSLNSRGYITIEGEPGLKIPNGFKVSDKEINKVFQTVRHMVLDESGIGKAPIQSLEKGLHTNVPAYTLNTMVNPIRGVEKVYNEDDTYDGSDIETDEEFRERIELSSSLGGGSTREAIRAALLDMNEVKDAEVLENDEMIEVNGLPPKSIAPLVFGGSDDEIAQTILKSKSAGIRSYGTTEVKTIDSKGQEQIIGFTRPTIKEVFVYLIINRDEGYPGDETVKRAIVNYIGGKDKSGIEYKGLGFGKDVVLSKLLSSVMCLNGIQDIKVNIGLDKDKLYSQNITIDTLEIAECSEDRIVIHYE